MSLIGLIFATLGNLSVRSLVLGLHHEIRKCRHVPQHPVRLVDQVDPAVAKMYCAAVSSTPVPVARRVIVQLGRTIRRTTLRAYGFDLLAFCRWFASEGLGPAEVDTDVMLRHLTACRHATFPSRPGPKVLTLQGQQTDCSGPATVNRRLAAVSGS